MSFIILICQQTGFLKKKINKKLKNPVFNLIIFVKTELLKKTTYLNA